MEPVLLLGKQRFEGVDIRIRASGGGHVSQIYGAHSQLAQHSFELFTVVQVGILIMFNFSLASTMQCATEQGSIGFAEFFCVCADLLNFVCLCCSYPTSHCQGPRRLLPEM
jgi:hypothetical protein